MAGSMMHGEDSEEVEIDLRESESGSTEEGEEEDSQDREEPLWRAPVPLEYEDNMDDTCHLVEISDTRPLINARDPRGINECLQVRVQSLSCLQFRLRTGSNQGKHGHFTFFCFNICLFRPNVARICKLAIG